MDLIGRTIVSHDHQTPDEERWTISLELDDGNTLYARANGAGEVCLCARMSDGGSLDDCIGKTITGFEDGEWSVEIELDSQIRLDLSASGREEVYLCVELV